MLYVTLMSELDEKISILNTQRLPIVHLLPQLYPWRTPFLIRKAIRPWRNNLAIGQGTEDKRKCCLDLSIQDIGFSERSWQRSWADRLKSHQEGLQVSVRGSRLLLPTYSIWVLLSLRGNDISESLKLPVSQKAYTLLKVKRSSAVNRLRIDISWC